MNPYTSFNLWRSESFASRFNGEVYPGHDNDVRIGFSSNENLACPGLNKSWTQQSQLLGKRTRYWHLMCTTQGPITYQEKELRLIQDISNQLNLNAITVVGQTVSYCNPPWNLRLNCSAEDNQHQPNGSHQWSKGVPRLYPANYSTPHEPILVKLNHKRKPFSLTRFQESFRLVVDT